MFGKILRAIALFVLIASATSCTMMKRHYRQGFYTGPKSAPANPSRQVAPIVQKHSRQGQLNDLIVEGSLGKQSITAHEIVSLNKKTITGIQLHRRTPVTKSKQLLPCDTIFFADGTVVAARVLEIGPRQIKYRYCTGPNQEMRFVQKAAVSQIIYANGTIEKFNAVKTEASRADLPAQPKMNSFALAGFILSLVYGPLLVFGFILAWIGAYPIGILLMALSALSWLAALVFSIIGVVQISNDKLRYRGIVLAILGIIFSALPLLALLK